MAIGARTIVTSLDRYAIHIAGGFMTFYESILQNGICRRDCEVYSADIAFKAQKREIFLIPDADRAGRQAGKKEFKLSRGQFSGTNRECQILRR